MEGLPPFQPARGRALPAVGLHVQDGDGLPRQPDRLGRLAVPPGHAGDASTRRRSSTCWPRTSSARGRRRCRRRRRSPADLRTAARRSSTRSATRARDRGRHPVRPHALPRRRAAPGRPLPSLAQHRRRLAVLLRSPQRQAAGLLGHRRRPAVQDPQQPEHPGRLPTAAAVRAADRSGAAGARRGRRARRRRRRQRAQPAAAAGPLPAARPEGGGDLPGGEVARRRAARRRWRRRTTRRCSCSAQGTSARSSRPGRDVSATGSCRRRSRTGRRSQRSLANAVVRYAYYESLLGAESGVDEGQLAQLSPLDTAGLEKSKFTSTEPAEKPRERQLQFDVVPDIAGTPRRSDAEHVGAPGAQRHVDG